jgi:hypothetical protein
MPTNKLKAALSGVNWDENVKSFLDTPPHPDKVAQCSLRLAIWAKQFEEADLGNPALSFVREMQIASHNIAALTALALYKPAAASMRTMFETALYYSYFRTHPAELSTLIRERKYYIDKTEIIEFHKLHTPNFSKYEQLFGLVGKITEWYREVSAIIHGQIPGAWVSTGTLSETKHSPQLLSAVTDKIQQGEELVHQFFLCTVGKELWDKFSSQSKRKLVAGLQAPVRIELGLDKA